MEKVFKWFTKEAECDKAELYATWFTNNLTTSEFRGVDQALFCFLKFCVFLGVVPSVSTLRTYVRTDLERDIKKYNIKLDSMTAYDYTQVSQLKEASSVISQLVLDTYNNYVGVDLTDREFKVDCYDYFEQMKTDLVQDAFTEYYSRLTDGSSTTQVSEEFRIELSKIDERFDVTKLSEFNDTSGSDKDMKFEFIAKTGIPCIDEASAIYTHLMTTLTADGGAGKTRFALANYAYPVLTQAKKDVVLFETELIQMQIENILIAYHIIKLYGGKIKIPDKLMNEGKLTQEQQKIYNAAKYDLFESGKYGKFIFRGKPIVETMKNELKGLLRTNHNIKLIIYDYMGLIRSVPQDKYSRPLDKNSEVIPLAYEIVRDILMDYPVHALCINQYNDKGVDASEKGKPIRQGYTQGGQIVWKHTDYDYYITMTPEQDLADVFMLTLGKSRGSSRFRNVLFKTDKSVSQFIQSS